MCRKHHGPHRKAYLPKKVKYAARGKDTKINDTIRQRNRRGKGRRIWRLVSQKGSFRAFPFTTVLLHIADGKLA